MARTKTSKAWMHEHVTDIYVRRANGEFDRLSDDIAKGALK